LVKIDNSWKNENKFMGFCFEDFNHILTTQKNPLTHPKTRFFPTLDNTRVANLNFETVFDFTQH
jgi:hypothetical protein